ncbi:MAG: hypothetical protein ACREIC_02540, partial [Limisphaerales bacterium]
PLPPGLRRAEAASAAQAGEGKGEGNFDHRRATEPFAPISKHVVNKFCSIAALPALPAPGIGN